MTKVSCPAVLLLLIKFVPFVLQLIHISQTLACPYIKKKKEEKKKRKKKYMDAVRIVSCNHAHVLFIFWAGLKFISTFVERAKLSRKAEI